VADRTKASLGIVLDYQDEASAPVIVRNIPFARTGIAPSLGMPAVAFVGAGNYAGRVFDSGIPSERRALFAVATANGSTPRATDANTGSLSPRRTWTQCLPRPK